MELSSLTLTVTERCNLRCEYCTVPFDRGRTMSADIVDAAIALFDRHGAKPEATLSFYGGEPMLRFDRCKQAVEGARRAFDGKRRLRVLTPTNCTAFDDAMLAWCRSEEIELALSVDGDANETERRFADGHAVASELLRRLPSMLAALPPRNLLARMTVTPKNVGRLAENVRRLARMGFRRIVYLVAYERAWDAEAIALWEREHRRIGTWLLGATGVGKPVPDLPGWRAIEERLLLKRPRASCGAGQRIAAVSTDGGLYPCYRLVFHGEDPATRLGDVHAGFTNQAALADFRAFDPNEVRPEEGSCGACEAEDGCTHACPALGLEMLGDLHAVPAIACRLMRAQVAAIRPYTRIEMRAVRRSTKQRVAAAFIAAAMTSTGAAAAACGGSTESVGNTVDGGSGGAAGDGSAADVIGPGVCSFWDSSAGGIGGGGGICPAGGYGGIGGGGICAGGNAGFDAASGGSGGTAGGTGGVGGGGICMVEVDAGDDAGAGGFGGGGGLCPYNPDSGGGGLC